MDDGGLLGRIWSFLSVQLAAWAAACAFIVHLVKLRNERLRDINSEEAGDWERIRHERDVAREERDLVRDKWAQCEAEKVALMQENATLKGILQGVGEWREAQAIRDAGKRLAEQMDATKPSDGNGGDNA